METYCVGTPVELILEGQSGFISAIEIRRYSIFYEITFLKDGERRKEWVDDTQFRTEKNKTKIGFLK